MSNLPNTRHGSIEYFPDSRSMRVKLWNGFELTLLAGQDLIGTIEALERQAAASERALAEQLAAERKLKAAAKAAADRAKTVKPSRFHANGKPKLTLDDLMADLIAIE